MVFDTRSDAGPGLDGYWQNYIEENTLRCDVEHWIDAYETLMESQSAVTFVSTDAAEETVAPYSESQEDEDITDAQINSPDSLAPYCVRLC